MYTANPSRGATYRAGDLPPGSVVQAARTRYVRCRNTDLLMRWEQPIPNSQDWLVTYVGRLPRGEWMTDEEKREAAAHGWVPPEPRSFSVTVRTATAEEVDAMLPDGHVNVFDGAAAIVVDGRVVAIHNEYGTLSYPPHCDKPDTYETLVAQAMDVYELHMIERPVEDRKRIEAGYAVPSDEAPEVTDVHH